MNCRLATIAAVSIGALNWAMPAVSAQPEQEQTQRKKAPQRKSQQASLTGCVDEQDGQYVLIHDQTRELIARLEADGFPTEGFARHVGHKVTVRGTASSSGESRPAFKVRTVDTLSDSCGPQEHSK